MNEQKDKPEKDTREKKEIKEPFRPEDTPEPPQVMDASREPDPELGENADKQGEKTEEKKRKD